MSLRIAVLLLLLGGAAPLRAEPENLPADTPTRTIALMPFNNRAGATHAGLAQAITTLAGNAIHAAGGAVVQRDHVVALTTERRLAAGFTDRADPAGPGPVIGADLLVFGYYDVIDGQLIVTAEPVSTLDFIEDGAAKARAPVRASGPVTDPAGVLQALAEQLAAALHPVAVAPAEAAPHRGVVAVFNPATFSPAGDAPLVSEAIGFALIDAFNQNPSTRPVDRAAIDRVLAEQAQALSGLSERGAAIAVGRLLGADFIAVGSALADDAGRLRVDCQLMDGETGTVVCGASVAGDDPSMTQLVADLLAGIDPGAARVAGLRRMPDTPRDEARTLAARAEALVNRDREANREKNQVIAERLLELALALNPDSGYAHLYTAGYYNRLAKQENADPSLRDRAEFHYRRAHEAEPDNPWLSYQLGYFLAHERKQHDEGVPYMRSAFDFYTAQNHRSMPRVGLWLGRALDELNRDDEALAVFMQSLAHSNKPYRGATWHRVALIHAARNDAAAEAEARYRAIKNGYGKQQSARFRTARMALLRVGRTDDAMEIFQDQLRSCPASTRRERPELVQYLAIHKPALAAEIAYQQLADHHSRDAGLWPWYEATLRSLGYPPRRAPFTGSVFDLDAMRRLGVRYHLQVYDGFRYADKLAYMRAYLEDTLGVPVTLGLEPRPLAAAERDLQIDTTGTNDPFYFDLLQVHREHGAYTTTGLISSRQVGSEITGRWAHTPLAMSTTSNFDTAFTNARTPPPAVAAASMSYLLQQCVRTFKITQPKGEGSHDSCIAQACGARTWNWHQRAMVTGLCSACRSELRARYPDWPAGPDHRDAIEAGPRRAAIDAPAGVVELLFVGYDALPAHADAAARAVTLSTGLPARPRRLDPAVTLPRQAEGWVPMTDLAALADAHAGDDAVAVCVLLNDRLQTVSPRWLGWYAMRPDDPLALRGLRRPVVMAATFATNDHEARAETVQRLTVTEPLTPPDGGAAFDAPVYAKYFVAGLAAVGHDARTCWTYGCPTTLIENLADPFRPSYWLCDGCRAAMQPRFSRTGGL